jgi:tetratricopeptide (TPR) repeat protein
MSVKTLRDLTATGRDQVNRAKTAIQSKNFDYAILMLQAALKDEPLYFEGRQLLRATEIQKFKSTGTLTRQMATMRTSTMALKLSGKKTPQEQLVSAEEILATDPFNDKANIAVGEAGLALGCPELKCFSYETLVQSKSDDKSAIPLLRSLAEAYMEAKQPEKAGKTYERILGIDPRDGDALSGMKNAEAAKTHENWEGAEKSGDFREALKSQKESENLEQESKIVKSSDAIEDQIQINYQKWQAEPQNPNHSKAIAALYVQRNEFQNAVPWYEEAFRAGGGIDSSLEKTIGDLKLRAGEQELHALREAAAAQTDPEAAAQFQAAIEAKDAEVLALQLELAEARVRAQPNEGEFRYELGAALYRAGNYKRATEELQQSLKQPSVRYQALNLLGLCFMKRGMLDFAINRLTLAESELPGMDDVKKEITYNLGLAYEAAKQPNKSLEQWKKIYEHDMTYRDVAARVESSYGNGSEAAS